MTFKKDFTSYGSIPGLQTRRCSSVRSKRVNVLTLEKKQKLLKTAEYAWWKKKQFFFPAHSYRAVNTGRFTLHAVVFLSGTNESMLSWITLKAVTGETSRRIFAFFFISTKTVAISFLLRNSIDFLFFFLWSVPKKSNDEIENNTQIDRFKNRIFNESSTCMAVGIKTEFVTRPDNHRRSVTPRFRSHISKYCYNACNA